MSRTLPAQLTTAKLLLAQFVMQTSEYDTHMEGTVEEKAEAISSGRFDPTIIDRIDGLRTGLATWAAKVAELEHEPAKETPDE